jgi:hypothetical protein
MNAPHAASALGPLAGAQHASVADLLLQWLGRALQRVGRRRSPPSFLYTALVFLLLNLLVFLIIAVSSPYMRTLSASDQLVIAAGAASLPLITLVVVLTTKLHGSFLSAIESQVVPVLTAEADTHNLARWLRVNLGMPRQLGLILVFGGLFGPLSVVIARSALAFDVNASTMIVAVLCGVQGAIYLPTFVAVLALPYHLSRYHLNLRTIDPANSDLVECLHTVLIANIFFMGIFAASVAIWLWSFGLLPPQTAIILVGMQWLIIASTFSIGQYGLARIIRSAKQHKLNEIQARIALVEQDSDPTNKDTTEAILRLIDYYNQVKAMRGSALDVSGVLGFLQSLLLPLIASLLANVSAIMELLKP